MFHTPNHVRIDGSDGNVESVIIMNSEGQPSWNPASTSVCLIQTICAVASRVLLTDLTENMNLIVRIDLRRLRDEKVFRTN